MVHRAGCGPPGCRIQHLTVDKLVHAFDTLRHPETMMNAKALGAKMAAENGVAKGVESFYRNLVETPSLLKNSHPHYFSVNK